MTATASDSAAPTPSASTLGAEIMACANYSAFQDSVDKFAHERGRGGAVSTIRNAVAHAVDHGVDAAAAEYDLSPRVVQAALDWLNRAAAAQYSNRYDQRKGDD